MDSTMRSTCLLALLVSTATCLGQAIHPQAHAHNDYEHARPLFDAMDHGFRSVEVDIHLIDDRLYVAHGRPKASERRTLESLYLSPLDSMAALEAGRKFIDSITLLVDIKTNPTATLQKLLEVLRGYPRLFPTGIVRIIISGNRDYELILKSANVSIDGRPDDLGKGYPADKMPLISDQYRHWMQWNGKGTPNSSDLEKVRALAQRVHAENKKLRLWAIPDREEAWSVLLDAGVDLINTDRLEAMNMFLDKRSNNK